MGIPKCRYCKKSLNYWLPVKKCDNGKSWNPEGLRGRGGLGLFCSLVCTEQWANMQLTGKAEPIGDSHKAKSNEQHSQSEQ